MTSCYESINPCGGQSDAALLGLNLFYYSYFHGISYRSRSRPVAQARGEEHTMRSLLRETLATEDLGSIILDPP